MEQAAVEAPTEQTNLPAQSEVDDFDLDLDKNPLEAAPVDEQQPAEKLSRKQWEEGFQEFIKNNPRGQRIWESYSEMQRLASPPEEGGLGFKPDVDQIKTWQKAGSILDEMVLDFTSGTPQAAEKFVGHWFGVDENGQGYETAAQIAAAIPQVLQKVNPVAYKQIGSHFSTEIVDYLQSQASIPGRDADDVARLNDAINVISHLVGVKPRGGVQQQQAPVDPVSAELAAARAEIERLRRGPQQDPNTVRREFTQNLDRVLEADANEALKSIKDITDPLAFKAFKKDMIDEMRQIAWSNPSIKAQIDREFIRMSRQGQVGEMGQVVRLFRQGYRDGLSSIRGNYLKAAGRGATLPAEEARSIMQQASTKTAPTQGTAPQQSTTNPAVRQQGEDTKAFMQRVIQSRRAG